VRMRSRNPWVLARRRLLGWKVRLLTRLLRAFGGDLGSILSRRPGAGTVALAIGLHRTPTCAGSGPRAGGTEEIMDTRQRPSLRSTA
jgi:hypothetical protein